MKPLFRFLSLLLCSSYHVVAIAAPAAYASIEALTASADAIVVGQITKYDSADRMSVVPIETLKGQIPAGPLIINFSGILTGRDPVPQRSLLFLKKQGTEFGLLPVLTGGAGLLRHQFLSTDLSAVTPAGLKKSELDSPLQKVIKELALIHITARESEAFIFLEPLATARVEPATLRLAFNAMQQSFRVEGSLTGAIGLLSIGDAAGLEAVEAASGQLRDELQGHVGIIERSYQDQSPESVAVLSRWMRSNYPAERHAAAGALARIRTPGAVLALGPVLDDADFEMRWRAIGGLSLFANNAMFPGGPPASGEWPFRTAETARYSVFDREYLLKKGEQEHLAFWKQWWSENQMKIQSQVP